MVGQARAYPGQNMGWQIIKFNDMKIAIIGGSGFVGSRLIGLLQTVPNIELLNIDKQQE